MVAVHLGYVGIMRRLASEDQQTDDGEAPLQDSIGLGESGQGADYTLFTSYSVLTWGNTLVDILYWDGSGRWG